MTAGRETQGKESGHVIGYKGSYPDWRRKCEACPAAGPGPARIAFICTRPDRRMASPLPPPSHVPLSVT
jgi:hypothetical protein